MNNFDNCDECTEKNYYEIIQHITLINKRIFEN